MARIGLFGGSFDPVHYGHLRIAEEFVAAFALDELRFIPTARPPHRHDSLSAEVHRSAMLRIAIADHPHFVVDERELQRGTTCYTIDTLTEIRAQLDPGDSLAWLIGADSFLALTAWRRWPELLEVACMAVACRPGFDLNNWQSHAPAALVAQVLPKIQTLTVPHRPLQGTIALLPTTPLAISATAIRALLAAGQSARYLTPDAVLDYAERQLLYRS